MRLRAMAYNVHGFRAGVRAVAEAVVTEAPDLLILNETGYVGLRLRRFARAMGMAGATGLRRWRRVPNAVLVRPPWRLVRHAITVLPRGGRTVRRGVVVAAVGRAGLRVAVVAVHLGLSPQERVEHARIVTDLLAGRRERVIVGGDLNEEPSGRAAAWIAERYWDAFAAAGSDAGPTFPAADPRARIDYLFVSSGIAVERAWVGGAAFDAASDHRPVVADLVLRDAGAGTS